MHAAMVKGKLEAMKRRVVIPRLWRENEEAHNREKTPQGWGESRPTLQQLHRRGVKDLNSTLKSQLLPTNPIRETTLGDIKVSTASLISHIPSNTVPSYTTLTKPRCPNGH